MKKLVSLLALCLMTVMSANAAITKQAGWFEAVYAEWTAVAGATDYNVYVKSESGSYAKIDKELVRQYPGYYRADVVGLKAGSYQMKIVPVISGIENNAAAMETSVLTAVAHDRTGFAHVGMASGIGAYKNDGTLKDGAKVLYVTANSAKTVSTVVKIGSKDSNVQEYTGLQSIIDAYQKGYDTTPLAIRIIGTVKKENLDKISSSAEGLQVKGKGAYTEMPITIEGIGEDATISGFGILVRGCKDTEFRNFAIMLCMDDCLSLDTENSNIWIHNMDFFYGNTGGDADQAKGDGTVDIKAHSKNVTVSYCHFYDAGKCSLGGMSGEQTDAWHTYHHNWFDHSDSRHPRIRVQFFHVFNNYYDGNSKYGVGAAMGGTAFVENNYFRNCKYPMLSSMQGTDAEGNGTFSGENGGVIKAINNIIINPRKIQYYTEGQTDGKWDAVLATSRDQVITATAFTGGTSYNNEADAAARTTYIENKMEDPSTVMATVTGPMGAGRMNHGDFKWRFNNSVQDENYAVVGELKTALMNYKSTLIGFADGTTIDNGGATETVNSGDGKDISDEVNNSYVPSWAGGGGTITDGVPVIGSDDDYFWFNEANATAVNAYINNGVITGGSFKPTQVVSSSTGDQYSDYVGSIRLAQNESITFFHEKGIVSLNAYTSGNGSMSWQISTSTDGTTFTKIGSAITGSKGGHPNVSYAGDPVKYVRITNTASGNRDVQGIKLYEEGEKPEDTRAESNLKLTQTEMTLNIGETSEIEYRTSSIGTISFTSSAQTVASVDATGNVTALGEGTAIIKVKQNGDEDYKMGEASITVKVVDPRAASTFAVTSDSKVSIKETETAQISVDNAAGAVTYKSSNTGIATVDATGKITAVGAGKATISVTDAGTSTVKGATVTVEVTVTKDMTGVEICHFTDKKISQPYVTQSGDQWSTGNTFDYNGTNYPCAVKLNSKESVTITPTADCTVKLYFTAAASATTLNGQLIQIPASGIYTFEAKAGTEYKLDKSNGQAKEVKLFVIELTPKADATNITKGEAAKKVVKYLNKKNGQIIVEGYSVDGKKM